MEPMALTTKQAAAYCGLSERALRYYDHMGLVCPRRTESNYRMYTEAELLRLQEVLFYRSLDIPIERIRVLLHAGQTERTKALQRHRELLLLRRAEIDRTLTLLNNMMEETDMKTKERACGMTYAQAKTKYRKEVEARWGTTEAYRVFEEKTRADTAAGNDAVMAEAAEIFSAFAALAEQKADPAGEAAQRLVKAWEDSITKHWYPCTKPILAGLSEMYVCDERFKNNLDAYGTGTAQLMHDAIRVYCAV